MIEVNKWNRENPNFLLVLNELNSYYGATLYKKINDEYKFMFSLDGNTKEEIFKVLNKINLKPISL